ncbi:hypothetical protein [Thalassospira australica]|uniref:hypothetical protein n=1 Tax=Thalassospira australica TaxID=1528106 RepID=UPI0012E01B50|nr:hypothetical protein [Thalassospira australica]
MTKNNNEVYVGYWTWFLKGSGGKPGYHRLLSYWIMLDVFVGALSGLKILEMSDFSSLFLPIISVTVGLVIAVVIGAVSVYSNYRLYELSGGHSGGYFDYIYPYFISLMLSVSCLVYFLFMKLIGGSLEYTEISWLLFDGVPVQINLYVCLGGVLISILLRTVWRTVCGIATQIFFSHKFEEYKKTVREDTLD